MTDKAREYPADATIYERMVAIIGELPAIGKTQQNTQQNFMFRGHDDVMNALNPLLAKHGVFIVPRVIDRVTAERQTSRGATMYEVNLHVTYSFYGAKGDHFVASAWGEGTDMGDKATNKAMTMAFKYVIAQAFALATAETSDADATSPEETQRGSGDRKPASTGKPPARNFDPGKTLLEGAIHGDNAAEDLQVKMHELNDLVDWPAVIGLATKAQFGVSDRKELTTEQLTEWWRRTSNAVRNAEMAVHPELGLSPEQIGQSFAWAFPKFTPGEIPMLPEKAEA